MTTPKFIDTTPGSPEMVEAQCKAADAALASLRESGVRCPVYVLACFDMANPTALEQVQLVSNMPGEVTQALLYLMSQATRRSVL